MQEHDNTTEAFLSAVRDAVVARGEQSGTLSAEQCAKLRAAKLLYGLGDGSYRGVCVYEAWENGAKHDVIEIAARAQESWVQIAGTLVHEMGHVLAGHGAGHGAEWKIAARNLGFVKRPAAAGQCYSLSLFPQDLRFALHAMATTIGDGHPSFRTFGAGTGFVFRMPRPCSAGIGTRGGKSRGKGSGSRLRLFECSCETPVKVRAARDELHATCDDCGEGFHRA